MDPWVRRDGLARPRSPAACIPELRTSVTSRESLARKQRYADGAAHGGRLRAGHRGWYGARTDKINARPRRWADRSRTEDKASCLWLNTQTRVPAQVLLRHVAHGLRRAVSAPTRRLRHLQAAIRPHAVRRSLPRDRQGARAALQQSAISASVNSRTTRSWCGRRALISRPRLAPLLATHLAALVAALLAMSAAATPDQTRRDVL
jgi:hypothetical protein